MRRLASNVENITKVLNAVSTGVTIQDPDGKLVFVNDAAAHIMHCESGAEALKKGSDRIREEFENGKHYYALQGQLIALPVRLGDRPEREARPARAGGHSTGSVLRLSEQREAIPSVARDPAQGTSTSPRGLSDPRIPRHRRSGNRSCRSRRGGNAIRR